MFGNLDCVRAPERQLQVVRELTRLLASKRLAELGVIPWASPVISFGDFQTARVATLGLNPSNREFTTASGCELAADQSRFPTLRSLGLTAWGGASDEDLNGIIDSNRFYFRGNPYDLWFQALNKLLVQMGDSYYGFFATACHLDLVPFATAEKWANLSGRVRAELINMSAFALGEVLRGSQIETLVLNGRTVIDQLQIASGAEFNGSAIPDWTLPRRGSGGVSGFAFEGGITRVGGVELGREVRVLGFSHNIQSSFGVTNEVRSAIGLWLGEAAAGRVCAA